MRLAAAGQVRDGVGTLLLPRAQLAGVGRRRVDRQLPLELLSAIDERVEFLHDALAKLDNVEIDVFRELVVEFAKKWDAKAIVKGLRVISDFEWEFQMNQLNRHLAPDVETVYVMASPQVSFVSSSGVKEIAAFGGDISALVPEPVARRFKELFPNGRPGTPENPTE